MATQLAAVKRACRVNDEAFGETLKNFSKFKTEKDVASFLNRQIIKRGAKLSFPTIIANGKNAFELHHKPKHKKLTRGFTVIDFGSKVSGFCTDTTRTIFIGNPNKKEKKIYNLVLTAQKACVSASKPGTFGSYVDHLGTELLGQYAPYLKHALGHGLSKKIHDKPNISPRSADKLKSGQIIAIEPGVYIKNKLGIRIEDTVLVGKKPTALTKFTKNLITIKLAK